MKKNVNYIDACKFEALIIASGLRATPQSGFVRIDGAKGRRAYVAKTKLVGRVDLSGFTTDHPAVRPLDEDEAFGNVQAQLDFSQDEASVLEAFERVLEDLATLPAAEPKPRKSSGRASNAVGWTKIAAAQ